MEKTRKERWTIAGHPQMLVKWHADLWLAASLTSIGAVAACSGDNTTNAGTANPRGLDASATIDASIKGSHVSIPGVDSGNPGADSGNPGSDSGANAGLAQTVRAYIGSQTPGGITMLRVPATDSAIPVPPDPAAYPGRYDITEAKRYLGKLLFHDPVRTQRVNINQGQPLEFPAATAFGGTIGISDSDAGAPPSSVYGTATTAQAKAVRDSTAATGSCGSCHIGEAAGKAGQVLNFNTGGEGRGYTAANGKFVPRRRPRSRGRWSARQ